MAKTLVIVPTKNRPEYMNCLVQNLIYQEGEFDVYIGDMSDDHAILSNNWLFRNGLERLRILGHSYFLTHIDGTNQLDALNAGLDYAVHMGYEYCLDVDDDIIFDPLWIKKGIQHMSDDYNLGCCTGITLIPSRTIEQQTIGGADSGLDASLENHPDFDGSIEHGSFVHCVYMPVHKTPWYYERIYGPYFFRAADGEKVGGFPKYLSPSGFAGEGIFQSAIFFMGRKLMVDPDMICWHYQAPYGGLRYDPHTRQKHIEHDLAIGKKMMDRRLPDVRVD